MPAACRLPSATRRPLQRDAVTDAVGYSARSDSTGLTRSTRRAGRYAAIAPTSASTAQVLAATGGWPSSDAC
jgi:hypothetical protein